MEHPIKRLLLLYTLEVAERKYTWAISKHMKTSCESG